MQCLITWIEGEEVQYQFLDEETATQILESEADKNYIFTKLG